MPGTFPGTDGMNPIRQASDSGGWGWGWATAGTIRETGGPTNLSVGAIADGELLKRSGSSVLGQVADELGTSAATANKTVRRDANGRAQVADPSVAADIATKGSVDSAVQGQVHG